MAKSTELLHPSFEHTPLGSQGICLACQSERHCGEESKAYLIDCKVCQCKDCKKDS